MGPGGPAQGLAPCGEQLAGRGGLGSAQPFGGCLPAGVHRGQQRRQDRDPLAGALVHPRLAARALLGALGDVSVADRARRGPGAPPGRVVGCPLGQVEVEAADRDQVVEGVDPGRVGLGDVPAG